ncbi:putative MFS family arabinose efflux permease [Amycolatopsis sulphurea]|uniref:Putative MFS family arabinose efflux permease n=1 Tax=Amycolatopsis sulphurea TaxID=76022 RepID=A0A2A9FBK0_9PSEU|nr:MFS transporter [Amycolatopsis sulphurea]PFG48538.1 putative MFS family arabinose efflux permease [Amycolatopsis sulphurea]
MTAGPERVTFREVFGVAEFRAMWFGELLSIAGDQLARVALSVLVYANTGSATLTGLTYALTFFPSLFGGIFLTGLADRFPRRTVMVTVDLARAALTALVAIPGLPLWTLCVLVGCVSLLNPPFKASQLALLPQVLPGDRFVVGMGIRSMTVQSAQLLGFAGGGALLMALDPRLALVLDAGTFVLSALFLRFGLKDRPAAASGNQRKPFLSSLSSGGRIAFSTAALRPLMLFTWLAGLLPVYEGIAAPYVSSAGGGSTMIGLLLAADPVGSVLFTFAYTRWVPAGLRPRLIGPMTALAAIPLLICFFQPGPVASLVLFVISGGFGTIALLQATASLTVAVPDETRAQTMGLSNTGLTTTMGVVPLIGGVLADQFTAQTTVGIFGLAGLLITIPLSIMWRRAGREPAADEREQEAARAEPA